MVVADIVRVVFDISRSDPDVEINPWILRSVVDKTPVSPGNTNRKYAATPVAKLTPDQTSDGFEMIPPEAGPK